MRPAGTWGPAGLVEEAGPQGALGVLSPGLAFPDLFKRGWS